MRRRCWSRRAQRFKRTLRPYRGFVAEAGLIAPGEEPRCEVWADRRVVHATVSLPLAWFIDVWARGIAVVDGCFVLAVEVVSPDGRELGVRAVRLERRNWKRWRSFESPALVTRRRSGEWQLRWVYGN